VSALHVAAAAGVGIGHELWYSSAPSESALGSTSNGSGISASPSVPGGFSFPGGYVSPFAGQSSAGSSPTQAPGSPSDVAAIAAKVDPALVDINSTFSYLNASGAGTGIVVSSDGEVITNNHVIQGASAITATDVGNGKTYTATVIGYDPSHDMAVLKLNGASGLQTAAFADSSRATVGEPIVGVGNAGGAGGTPIAAGGAITALNQSITAGNELTQSSEQLSGLIEVNAAIQSGDSGGALVNAQGEVIGMDTAASEGFTFSASAGQGYAIPINQMLATAAKAELGQGTPTLHVGPTAFLGIEILPSASAGGLGSYSSGGGSASRGVTIASVVAGEPAQAAGLVANDTITAIDGQTVGTYAELGDVMLSYHPGDRVSVAYTTPAGAAHSVQVTLASGPAS